MVNRLVVNLQCIVRWGYSDPHSLVHQGWYYCFRLAVLLGWCWIQANDFTRMQHECLPDHSHLVHRRLGFL